jgi:DNA-dependent RNA polymerase auxiliary subunit epsilon
MSKMSDLYIKVEESATLTELEERVVSNWNIKRIKPTPKEEVEYNKEWEEFVDKDNK